MMYKNEITITREEFREILGTVMAELANTPLDVLLLAMFSAKAEMRFFGDKVEDNIKPEAPFKYGDTVFVTDNEGDGNKFVNRVVTVVKVYDDDSCVVTDGKYEQKVYVKNLKKVETP